MADADAPSDDAGEQVTEAPVPAPAAPRQENYSSGNLFLTVLRLRFEERGSWTAALENPDELEEEEPAPPALPTAKSAPPRVDAGGSDSPATSGSSAGRADGGRGSGSGGEVTHTNSGGGKHRSSVLTFMNRLMPGVFGSKAEPPPLAFGRCSASVRLAAAATPRGSGGSGRGAPLLLAERQEGEGDAGVVLTQGPLRSLPGVDPAAGVRQYYYEFEVLTLLNRQSGTLSLGFVWDPPAHGELPEAARLLPRSFVLGGDPLRGALEGEPTARAVGGWRPRFRLTQGCTVGVLLNVRHAGRGADSLQMVIFQDGERQTTLTQELSSAEAAWAMPAEPGPHGVIDLVGNVAGVRLIPGAPPPSAPTSPVSATTGRSSGSASPVSPSG